MPRIPQQNSGFIIAVKTSDLKNSNRPKAGSIAQLKLLPICKNLKSGAKTLKIFILGDKFCSVFGSKYGPKKVSQL